MKKFFSFIIKQSVAIVLVVVFVLAFGIYSTLKMPINLLPDINVPMVCVQIIYPGANAQSVETDVTEKVEDGLSAISGVTGVDSYSYDNLSAVVLSFDYGTDTTEKKTDIQNKLSALTLPDGITTSVYDIDLNAEALATLSVTSGTGASEDEKLQNAYKAAKELSSRLSAIDGVESVEIKGGAETYYRISPYVGLELTAPLFVQAFSYGALDIPLGNITQDGGDVQIRNNSDVTSEADIKNMPIALPSSMVTLLSSEKQLMRAYQNRSADELTEFKQELESEHETDYGVVQVLRDVDAKSADDLDRIAELKLYMNLVDTCSEAQLRSIHDYLYPRVKDKDEQQLEEIANEINSRNILPVTVTVEMLKAVQDGKIEKLAKFKKQYGDGGEDGYTDADYVKLARYMDLYTAKDNGDPYTDAEITEEVIFAKKTSATGLAAIADKKQEAEEAGEATYRPTDAECALLFTGTELSAAHPIVASPTFIAFLRADSYEDNMQLLIERRRELTEKHYDEETQEESDITAEEFYKLYSDLDLDGVFEYKLSEELIGFILEMDLTNLVNGSLIVGVDEIADVNTAESYSSYVYYGSGGITPVKGTIIEIYKSNGANSSSVVSEVKRIYAEFIKEYGVKFGVSAENVKLLDDQSEFISDSISNVLVSMLIGGVLAVLVIFVFLKKVRTSLIIAITMPLSVLASLVCLSLMGITLNMVSLGGLAVGIGMLVDNSIVVIESVSKHRDMDKPAFEAAVDGTTEVGGALFGSTLTTVCVFIPIIFSGGLTGEIFTDLSWAVIFSLTFSLIVAVTVIPALYVMFNGGKRMLKGGRLSKKTKAPALTASENAAVSDDYPEDMPQTPQSETKSFRKKLAAVKEPRLMNAVANFYGNVLPKFLNRKLVTIITAVAIFGASIGLLFLTGTEFLPSIDKGQLEVNISYSAGHGLDEKQDDVLAFAKAIESGAGGVAGVDNVEYISVSVGKNGLLALTDTGIISVQLKDNRGTDKTVNRIREIAEAFNKADGNAIGRSFTVKEIDGVVASLMSGADDMSVTIVGDDSDKLKEIAEKICVELEKEENGFKDVKNSATDSSVEYDLKFDRTKMAELGLDYQTLVLTLRIGLASYTACSVKIDGETYNLNVQFNDNSVTSIEELENFVVGADSDGKAVKIKDICEITREEPEACIRRTNGKQMVSVSAAKPGTDTGSAGKQMQKIAKQVLKEYEGYSFESSGISSYLNDAFGGLAVALVISFFLLFAVMAVQFGSAVKPLIIMAGIPFSFTGGFIALVITGTSLNVVSFIGLIMLMGVIVNNAIVMLEKIKQLHDEGMEHFRAVREACKVRLRPIFMTTLTTILALIPLAIGVGQGSELMQPLGIVVIGGLLLGTLVTLVIVPAVYCAVYRLSAKYPEGKKHAAKQTEQL